MNVTMPTSSQYFSASDHYSFWQKNIPVMFFFTGMHPQYHRPTDTFQTINIKGMRQCAELGQNIVEEPGHDGAARVRQSREHDSANESAGREAHGHSQVDW